MLDAKPMSIGEKLLPVLSVMFATGLASFFRIFDTTITSTLVCEDLVLYTRPTLAVKDLFWIIFAMLALMLFNLFRVFRRRLHGKGYVGTLFAQVRELRTPLQLLSSIPALRADYFDKH
jgi:hypothetical protein